MTAESEIDPSGPLRVRVSSHLSATVQESKVVMPTVNYGLRLCRRTRGRPGSAVASWLRCEDEGAAAVRPPSSVVCTVCVVLAHALLPDFIRSVLTPWSPFPAALAHLHSADRGRPASRPGKTLSSSRHRVRGRVPCITGTNHGCANHCAPRRDGSMS